LGNPRLIKNDLPRKWITACAGKTQKESLDAAITVAKQYIDNNSQQINQYK
jgi:hypothetical protein